MHSISAFVAAVILFTAIPIAHAYPNSGDHHISYPLLLNFLEYTFYLNASQIFADDTIKSQVLDNQSAAHYSIPNLEHELFGSVVNATNVKVNVTPTAIDETTTKLDLEIYADQVDVTNGRNMHYENVQLQTLYGLYDRSTDLIEMHVPLDVALAYLGQQ